MKLNISTIALSISVLMTAKAQAASPSIFDLGNVFTPKGHNADCSNNNCELVAGTFSSEKYAERYKHSISNQTNHHTRVTKSKHNGNIFEVIIGPFNDTTEMLKTASRVSGRPYTAPAKRPIRPAPRKATPNAPAKYQHEKQQSKANWKTIGSFSSEKYAERYKNSMQQQTKQEVKVQRDAKNKDVFHVLLAPIEGAVQMVESGFTAKPQPTTKTKRTVAKMPNQAHQTRHQKLLASQSDYPVHQPPKVDAKGNIIPLFKTGPYVGASFGPLTNVGFAPSGVAYQGMSGTLSAGAAQMFTHRFYLGGEFFIGDNIQAKSFREGISGYGINNGWFYGGDIIPGYMITDHVLGYLRAGVIRNQFNSSPLAPDNSRIAAKYLRRYTKVINAWELGGGLQTNLYKNLDGRFEYVFAYFKGTQKPKDYTIKGDMQRINLGLVYKFPEALKPADHANS